ncbi:Uncharacterised protein [Mycobacterium tuberculosis]|uniref:Uncharacterized protein n=1 Tax=Mycobacterium tuberculosis TaxID=1773 RepID=A0A654TCJ5_MYCTX|nr:Uncharacterised protein [Mycobacterium tuberculosis]CFR86942.1 Uncharacterised protein [Mycobacterium tuberculosis]CKS24644.1 Uncharacterised protein [Mycobacterium tuberculosis]CKS95191.1 Uncharacterised protein [Mycobacterium tuberculosis]CKT87885.1 Uncharacterised protein [Mycobacterium tuberculosis]
MHLEAEYRLEARDDLVVIEQFSPCGLGCPGSNSHSRDPSLSTRRQPKKAAASS